MRFAPLRLAFALALLPAVALAQTRGGTAIFVLTQDPPTANPVVSSGVPDKQIGCTVYGALVLFMKNYEIKPHLAKSWTISPDGLTYSFELAQTTWHDGKPFTSEDVKYSLTEVNTKFSSLFSPAGRAIESIDTPAPDKLVIHMKQPYGPFLLSLSCGQGGAIMPAHIYRGTDVLKNPATTATPIGTGAFKLAEWQRGDHVRLVRNPNYLEPGKPYLDEVVGKVVTTTAARVQALRAGEVDDVYALAPADQAVVRADPKLKVETSDSSPSIDYVFLNVTRKPLTDKRVRQALFMAMDRDYLRRNALFGTGTPGQMPFTSDIPWSVNPAIDYDKMYPFDPARANALLDEAGLKRGADGNRFSIGLLVHSTDYPEFQAVASSLKSMWKAIGVDVQIEALERATLLKRIFQDKDYDAMIMDYASNYDPAIGIARMFVSSAIGLTYGNASNYVNPEVDALLEKGQHGITFDDRGKNYAEVQAILATDLPVLTLQQRQPVDGASKRLHGLWGGAQITGGFWADAWIGD